MAVRTRKYLKGRFKNGMFPNENDFADWLESFWHVTETPNASASVYSINLFKNEFPSSLEEAISLLEEGDVHKGCIVTFLTEDGLQAYSLNDSDYMQESSWERLNISKYGQFEELTTNSLLVGNKLIDSESFIPRVLFSDTFEAGETKQTIGLKPGLYNIVVQPTNSSLLSSPTTDIIAYTSYNDVYSLSGTYRLYSTSLLEITASTKCTISIIGTSKEEATASLLYKSITPSIPVTELLLKISEMESKFSSLWKIKGSCTYQELPSDPEVNDVWVLTDSHGDFKVGDEVYWNGTNWSLIGPLIDDSLYSKVGHTHQLSDIEDASRIQLVSNLVQTLSSESLPSQYPSAKCVFDLLSPYLESHTISINYSSEHNLQKLFSLSLNSSTILYVTFTAMGSTWSDVLFYSNSINRDPNYFCTLSHKFFVEHRLGVFNPDSVCVPTKNSASAPSMTLTIFVIRKIGSINWFTNEFTDSREFDVQNTVIISQDVDFSNSTYCETDAQGNLVTISGDSVTIQNDGVYTVNATNSSGNIVISSSSGHSNIHVLTYGIGVINYGSTSLNYDNENLFLIDNGVIKLVDNKDYYSKSEIDSFLSTKESLSNKVTEISPYDNPSAYPTSLAVQQFAERKKYFSFTDYYYSSGNDKLGYIGVFKLMNSDSQHMCNFVQNMDKSAYWNNPLTLQSQYGYYKSITSDLMYVSVALFKSTAGTECLEYWFDDDKSSGGEIDFVENTGNYCFVIKHGTCPEVIVRDGGSTVFEVYFKILGKRGHTLHTRFTSLINDNTAGESTVSPTGEGNKFAVKDSNGDLFFERSHQDISNYPVELYSTSTLSSSTTYTVGIGYNLIDYKQLTDFLSTVESCTNDSTITVYNVTDSTSVTLHLSDALFPIALSYYVVGNNTFTYLSKEYRVTSFNVNYLYDFVNMWVHASNIQKASGSDVQELTSSEVAEIWGSN